MNEKLVREYRAAFAAANPDRPPPSISYSRGWYRISSMASSPVRETTLREMRDRLLRRVEVGR